MNNTNTVAQKLKGFINPSQLGCMVRATRGEEGEHFVGHITELANRIDNMPKVYETDGVSIDDKIISLHYFNGSQDWWIIEKDCIEGEPQYQAFGLANIGFGLSGLGYISIDELLAAGVDFDEHWTPCTVREMKINNSY